jgi:K+-sensing histidine kinase KdpD
MTNDLLEVTRMQAAKLTIELQANPSRKIRGRMSDENSELLLLEVSDAGCGVSPHLKERIFDRLYQGADLATADPKGLGAAWRRDLLRHAAGLLLRETRRRCG